MLLTGGETPTLAVIARLREVAGSLVPFSGTRVVLREAASTIERLEKRVDRLEAELTRVTTELTRERASHPTP